MVYATAEHLVTYYDTNVIGQLITDTDVPVSENQFGTNRYIIAAISKASGDIRQACQVANRYTDDDLKSIYESLDSSLSSQLIGLCCDRTFGYLIVRRSQLTTNYENLASRAKATDDLLEFLRQGGRLFTLPAQELAGARVEITTVVQTPNNSMTRSLSRYFPVPGLPANQGPYGPGPTDRYNR